MQRLMQKMRAQFLGAAASQGLCPEAMGLLETLTSDFELPASWGINSVEYVDGNLSFMVEGFLYQGKVALVPTEGKYDILLEDGRRISGIEAASLATVIDGLVEKDEHYADNVMKAYGLMDLMR